MTAAAALVWFLIPALVGCDVVWNWGNRGDLERDAVGLLRRHGMEAREPACHMVGTTRTGVCVFRAPENQVAGVVRGLRLTEADASTRAEGCPSDAGGAMFRSGRRPPELRLPHGAAFESLLLHRGASDRMCVQVEYAYG